MGPGVVVASWVETIIRTRAELLAAATTQGFRTSMWAAMISRFLIKRL